MKVLATAVGGWYLGLAISWCHKRLEMVTRPKPNRQESDAELLSAIYAGEQRALGIFYDRYGSLALSLAGAITDDATEAEHAVADAFAELWRVGPPTAVRESSAVARLSALVRAHALKRKKTGSSGNRTRAYGALTALAGLERQVIELAYFEGLTVRQIAAQLSASERDVYRTLRSAMNTLRSAASRNSPGKAGTELSPV
jgi:RNA polymerase sigma-70 factor (ECF subfamily)